MTSKNPYMKKSHLSRQKSLLILRYFSEDLTATQTSKLLGINRNTINEWYNHIRNAIYRYCETERNEVFNGTVEMDESYFGGKRVKGKRGRGAGGKIKVFGLLKRNGKVYTEIVEDVTAKTLTKIIQGKIDKSSTVNTDKYRSYDGLVHLGYGIHHRVNHGNNEFARGNQHINGIESFWSYAKRRLVKFNGVVDQKFLLHLKETEFRFNCGLQKKNIYNELLKTLKDYVGFLAKLV